MLSHKITVALLVPVYNESANLPQLHADILKAIAPLEKSYEFTMLFVNDGSSDDSQAQIENLAKNDKRVRYIEFSRNFGKELALTAGLWHASADAVIMLDADLQHPPTLIPEFITKWEQGEEVVIGIREKNEKQGLTRRFGSWLFYRIMGLIGETYLLPGETDFRLLDRKVIEEFKKFGERRRITRVLVDWLGFRRSFISFQAPQRANGTSGYSRLKLIKLALSSFVSHSLFPLKFAGYLGIVITFLSGVLGVFIFFEKYIFDDPWGLYISGRAILAVINTFLIGIVLSCLGLVALYVGNIHSEVLDRPLYIIRDKKV